jgi:hypothetical protein
VAAATTCLVGLCYQPLHSTAQPTTPTSPSSEVDGGPARPARNLQRQSFPPPPLPASPHTGVEGRSARRTGTGQLQQHLPPANLLVSNLASSYTSVVRDGVGSTLLPSVPAATAATTSSEFLALYENCFMYRLTARVSIDHSAGHQNIITYMYLAA